MSDQMGITGEVVWGKWVDASLEKPDADIMVLGYYAQTEQWMLVTWNGENWLDCGMDQWERVLRVSHWMHLPEGP